MRCSGECYLECHPSDLVFCVGFDLSIFLDLLLCSLEQNQHSFFFHFYRSKIAYSFLGEKGIVQGLYQVLLNILLTTWNASGWKRLLEASCPASFQNVPSFKVRLLCPRPCKAQFWKSWGMEIMQPLCETVPVLNHLKPYFWLFKKYSILFWPFSCCVSMSTSCQYLC